MPKELDAKEILMNGSFKIKPCAGCAKDFVGWVSTRYCSIECRKFYFRQTPKFTGITKNCLLCNAPFYVAKSQFNRKFCSNKCKISHTRKKAIKKCLVCGGNVEFKPCQNNRKKYCSLICRNKAHSGFLRLDISAKFKTPNSLKFRMKDAGLMSKCNRCNYSIHKEILVIHHMDRDRENNTLDNIEVLCPNCHAIEHYAKPITGISLVEKI